MSTALPSNYIRRAGSAWTIFTFGGQPISFCQQVQHTSPQPVGQGASAIQPMDEPYPVEILTPAAAGMGQIVLNLFELFGSGGKASKVWDRLGVGAAKAGVPFGKLGGGAGQGLTSQFENLAGSGPLTGAVDIVDVFIKQAQASPASMSVVQIIRPPGNPSNPTPRPYYLQYVGCVITNVQDGEQIDVGTLEVLKQITVAYRYTLRDGVPSSAFALRDGNVPTPNGTFF